MLGEANHDASVHDRVSEGCEPLPFHLPPMQSTIACRI